MYRAPKSSSKRGSEQFPVDPDNDIDGLYDLQPSQIIPMRKVLFGFMAIDATVSSILSRRFVCKAEVDELE